MSLNESPPQSAPAPSPDPATAFDIRTPDAHTVPLVFASPHSGSDYPADFVAGARLDPVALRRSEDGFVDELFAAAPAHGAPLLRALFPRAFIDANREPFELDQGMFSDRLPAYVNTPSSRVAAGLGTIARVVSSGQDIYPRTLTFAEAVRWIPMPGAAVPISSSATVSPPAAPPTLRTRLSVLSAAAATQSPATSRLPADLRPAITASRATVFIRYK